MKKERDLAIINTAYGVDKKKQEDHVKGFEVFMVNALRRKEDVLLPLPKFGRSQVVLLTLETLLDEREVYIIRLFWKMRICS
ncbi:hypothetical protein [Bacillus sp. B15-48]|uniref:hypothetical protein n=1 Tax=Bacillus sp. B15-48 TaxID=1548601 RepID=UPI00193F3583|nr:hypothetical protein [Bacillus sp. B15-48]MBM4764387.1 hypothetical protein [Bacillus sp. B15-48]